MSSVTLEQVLELAEQLSPQDQRVLASRLQPFDVSRETPEQMLERIEARRKALKAAGAFDNLESLAGRFGPPRLDISEEELRNTIHEAATEWEKEIDEFHGTI